MGNQQRFKRKVRFSMIKTFARKAGFSKRIDFHLTDENEQFLFLGKPVEFEKLSDMYTEPKNPTFSLSQDEAQILMDQLWDVGLRPSEGSGSAGAMAATQKHLEDMRRLVFEPMTKVVRDR